MDIQIEPGLQGHEELTVTRELTASHFGSGQVEVYATPAMIALMEKTCLRSVIPVLPEGWGTVGTLVNITHERASAVGCHVVCESTLVEVDRRRLVFEVTVQDENGIIGRGRHERFLVDTAKFMARAGSN